MLSNYSDGHIVPLPVSPPVTIGNAMTHITLATGSSGAHAQQCPHIFTAINPWVVDVWGGEE